jgi:hypothetical protein
LISNLLQSEYLYAIIILVDSIYMEKFIKHLPLVLLGVIGLITLIPFIFTGFSNGDDIAYFINARVGHFWDTANVYAKDQGRFNFLISVPIAECFYMFDNFLISKFISIILIFIDFIIIGYIAKELFGDKLYGYLCFLLIVVFISIKGIYNPIVSYPGYFSGSFLLILFAIYFALRYKNLGEKKYRLMSAIFFSIGLLFYETYIMYLPLIMIIVSTINLGKETPIKAKLKMVLPFFLIGLIYCSVYIAYRVAHPGAYEGAKFASKISLSHFFVTFLNFATGSYPMTMTFIGGIATYGGASYFTSDSIKNILYIIFSDHFEWIIKSFIISVMFYYIMQKITLPKPKNVLLILLIAFLYIYIPNIPLSLTAKYLSSGGLPYYTTTYFSMFSVIICFTIFLILLCSRIRNYKHKGSIYLIVSIFIGSISIFNDYANYHAVKALRIPLNVFNAADKFVQTKEYSFIQDNSYMYSPLFFDNREDIVHITYSNNWIDYLYFKSNKKAVIYSNSKDELIRRINNNIRPIYYLNYGRNQYDKDLFFAFSTISEKSKIDSINNYIVSDSVTIYYYSNNKTFSIFFETNNNDNTFLVNNEQYQKSRNFVEFDVLNKNYQNDFAAIKIKANEIDLNSIRVTNITKPGSLSITIH